MSERDEGMEELAKRLLKGEYSSLTIGFNDDHAVNYATAQRWHDQWGFYGGGADDDRISWVSEDERQEAITNNTVWTCQWYPDSPVGFYCIGASSFSALLDGLRDHLKGE